MPDLLRILAEETTIFRQFNNYLDLSPRAVAFAAPNEDDIPHWNSVYPLTEFSRLSDAECAAAAQFYSDKGVTGHVIVPLPEWSEEPGEVEDYFFWGGAASTPPQRQVVSSLSPDLSSFSRIVQQSFDMADSTREYFQAKMEVLGARAGSRFWIAWRNGAPVGCASTFVTDGGANYLFNVGVVPEARRQGVASDVILSVCEQVAGDIYTYTPTEAMAEQILPAAGFVHAGRIAKPALADYMGARATASSG